jgi:hypothetical protein
MDSHPKLAETRRKNHCINLLNMLENFQDPIFKSTSASRNFIERMNNMYNQIIDEMETDAERMNNLVIRQQKNPKEKFQLLYD